MTIMKHLLLFLFSLCSLLAYSQEAVKVKVTKPGTLSTLLTKAQQDACQYLIVSGKLNSADIKVLRKMAGADGGGSLRTLDLKDATIVSSEEPYLIIHSAEETVIPWISIESGTKWVSYSEFDPIISLRDANYVLLGSKNKLDAEAAAKNVSQWKKVKRQTLNAKGHHVERGNDGHYTYTSFTHKKLFCGDMFYQCPNLELVIIPRKGDMDNRVAIPDNPIRYTEVAKVIVKE